MHRIEVWCAHLERLCHTLLSVLAISVAHLQMPLKTIALCLCARVDLSSNTVLPLLKESCEKLAKELYRELEQHFQLHRLPHSLGQLTFAPAPAVLVHSYSQTPGIRTWLQEPQEY